MNDPGPSALSPSTSPGRKRQGPASLAAALLAGVLLAGVLLVGCGIESGEARGDEQILVTLPDGRDVDAELVGMDASIERVLRIADDLLEHGEVRRAWLEPGSRLLAANGHRLVSPLDFEAVLLDLRAGDVVELEVEGRSAPLRITAREFPGLPTERVTVLQGLELASLTPAVRDQRGVASEAGALVTRVASPGPTRNPSHRTRAR